MASSPVSEEATKLYSLCPSNSLGNSCPNTDELEQHNEKEHQFVEKDIFWVPAKSWKCIVPKYGSVIFSEKMDSWECSLHQTTLRSLRLVVVKLEKASQERRSSWYSKILNSPSFLVSTLQ